MTARESVQDKARRYVLEARLLVTRVDGAVVVAECRGSGEIYHLGHAPGRGWFCSCACRGVCSHLLALQHVVVRRPR